MGILGCILLEPARHDQAAEAGVASDWFLDLRHAEIFGTLSDMIRDGQAIDLVTVSNRLK
ncbi:DnaB-like helicase N-terminal domain-containing protein, partial [Escherichia coli]|uniref:DnaB-like helicase N-terminal domain-containing protein n=1 Tax=Escherichia coli TaxID=562 RepID=UPI0034DB5B1C